MGGQSTQSDHMVLDRTHGYVKDQLCFMSFQTDRLISVLLHWCEFCNRRHDHAQSEETRRVASRATSEER